MKVTSYLVASCPFRSREHSHIRTEGHVDCPHAYGVRGAGMNEVLAPEVIDELVGRVNEQAPKDTTTTYADTYGGRR